MYVFDTVLRLVTLSPLTKTSFYVRRSKTGKPATGGFRGRIRPRPPFQSYAVANTATFLFEATCEHDKSMQKNTKYLSGNYAHDCQNAFSFRSQPWALPLDPTGVFVPRPLVV